MGNDYLNAHGKAASRDCCGVSDKTNAQKCSITIVLLFLIFLMTNCTNSIKPIGVMAAPKMQLILWDLLKADEYLNEAREVGFGRNADSAAEALYQKVFLIHDTDKESFQKSLAYYQGRPDLSKPLFDSVMAMGERENRLYIVADSLNLTVMEEERWHVIRERLWRTKYDSMLQVYTDSVEINALKRLTAYWDTGTVANTRHLDTIPTQSRELPPDALLKDNERPSKPEQVRMDSLARRHLKLKKDSLLNTKDTMLNNIIKRGSSGRAERLKLNRGVNIDSLQRLNKTNNQ